MVNQWFTIVCSIVASCRITRKNKNASQPLIMNYLNKHNNEKLTKREEVVLKFVAEGMTNKKVAQKLDVTIDTVKKHLQNSYRKLGVNNKIEALQKAGIIKNHPLG
jgi:DNA-binding NarL/FixJ family response regulator